MSTSEFDGLNRYDETVGGSGRAVRSASAVRLRHDRGSSPACSGRSRCSSFASIAIAGYAKARRAGLLRSRCKIGDTRLVLVYLSALAVLAAVATPFWVMFWLTRWG